MRGMTFLFLFLLLAIPCTAEATDSNSITLAYEAETYTFTYAYATGDFDQDEDTDTDQDFSSNIKCYSYAHAEAESSSICEPGMDYSYENQHSHMQVSSEGVKNLIDVSVISKLKGWGNWYWYGCYGSGGSGDGAMWDAYGNGYTLLTGTIEIGIFEGYPQDANGLTLKLDAEITGDSPASWDTWDWWLKIWDDDPCSPLVELDDFNMSADLPVKAGETLNIEFYHEAEEDYTWPEVGLDSTITVDLNVCVPGPADIDSSGDVDMGDLIIMALQWLDVPGIPSADIAPEPLDNFVDYQDFAVVEQNWLNCVE